jgi:hypothetical protein
MHDGRDELQKHEQAQRLSELRGELKEQNQGRTYAARAARKKRVKEGQAKLKPKRKRRSYLPILLLALLATPAQAGLLHRLHMVVEAPVDVLGCAIKLPFKIMGWW